MKKNESSLPGSDKYKISSPWTEKVLSTGRKESGEKKKKKRGGEGNSTLLKNSLFVRSREIKGIIEEKWIFGS